MTVCMVWPLACECGFSHGSERHAGILAKLYPSTIAWLHFPPHPQYQRVMLGPIAYSSSGLRRHIWVLALDSRVMSEQRPKKAHMGSCTRLACDVRAKLQVERKVRATWQQHRCGYNRTMCTSLTSYGAHGCMNPICFLVFLGFQIFGANISGSTSGSLGSQSRPRAPFLTMSQEPPTCLSQK